MDMLAILALAAACAPQVDARTAAALVTAESDANPHAIGVVGGALVRQPRSFVEALSTAAALQSAGWNFSVGLAQINVRNLDRLGLTLASAFDPCRNLAAMQTVLVECYDRAASPAQVALRQALSCYYSGNFLTGFDHGYVRRVLDASRATALLPAPIPVAPATSPAPEVSR